MSQPQVEIGRGRPVKAKDPAVSEQSHDTQPEGMCRAGDRPAVMSVCQSKNGSVKSTGAVRARLQ